MRFSLIVWVTWLYIISIAVYIFKDGSSFWASYFWLDNSLLCLSGFCFNFIKYKSPKEKAHLLFLIILKMTNIIYYIILLIFVANIYDVKTWIGSIYFLSTMAISAFIAFNRFKTWKEN